ncbi:MAG: hypothetical protein IMW91_04305 [Firmicutes bacterium]|nr:hypothetical protein [Bacillota bacterium]
MERLLASLDGETVSLGMSQAVLTGIVTEVVDGASIFVRETGATQPTLVMTRKIQYVRITP